MLNDSAEIIVRGRNHYAARVTDTALGTIRSLELTVQSFEERAARLEADIGDRLRALRLNADNSQQEFADYCQLYGVPVTR